MGFYSSGINWWDIEEAAEFFERPPYKPGNTKTKSGGGTPIKFPEEDGPFVSVRHWVSVTGHICELSCLPTETLEEVANFLQKVVNVKPKCVIFGIAPKARLLEVHRELSKRCDC